MNRTERGFILIMSLLVMMALFFFALSYVRLFSADRNFSTKSELSMVADEAALAGIEQSLYQISQDSAWAAGFSGAPLTHSGAIYDVTFDNTQSAIPWSTNNASGSSEVTGWSGRSVPAHGVHIVSTGTAGTQKSTRQAIVQVSSALFHDHFDTVSGDWNEVMGGNFDVKNGFYHIGRMGQSAGEHRTFAGDTSWTDYVIEAKATLKAPQNQTSNGYGIYFRATNVSRVNGYVFQYDPGYNNSQGGSFIIRKVFNGSEQSPFVSVLRNSFPQFAEKLGQMDWWYNTERKIRIEITGNRFVVSVDGVKVLDAVDGANSFPRGEMGLRTWSNAYGQFEEVTVTGSGGSGSVFQVQSRF